MGNVMTKGGLKTDPLKIESILKLNPPENVTEILLFAGMVGYLQLCSR